MKKEMKYDPEDIESLLMHKEFSELYPEEREFVLQHIESPAEYASLRKTLYEVIEAGKEDQWLDPEPEIRENLLAQFAKEDRKGFAVWLNSLFAAPNVTWYRRPAVQFAMAGVAILLVVGVLFWNRPNPSKELIAENTPSLENDTVRANPQEELEQANVELIAENLNAPIPATLPPAPKVASIEFTEIEVTEDSPQDIDAAYLENDLEEKVDAIAESDKYVAPAKAAESVNEPAMPKTNSVDITTKYESSAVSKDYIETIVIESKKNAEGYASDEATIFISKSKSATVSELADLFDLLYTAP
jgi:hypothetical protein